MSDHYSPDEDRSYSYKVVVQDLDVPLRVHVEWQGDDKVKGQIYFKEECARIEGLVRKREVNSGKTKVTLREYDGTLLEEKII